MTNNTKATVGRGVDANALATAYRKALEIVDLSVLVLNHQVLASDLYSRSLSRQRWRKGIQSEAREGVRGFGACIGD